MNKRILIVDDSQTVISMLKEQLEASNYEVLTAQNGLEAVDAYDAKNPDLIIMDIMMPEMSGEEALKMIRKIELTKGIPEEKRVPIIMLTTKEESWMDSFADGCNSYMLKTNDWEKLLDKIAEQLERLSG